MSSTAADALVAKCKEVGVSSFVFVRHANSAPLETGAPKRADKPHDWRLSDQRRVLGYTIMSLGYADRLKHYPNKGVCGLPEHQP